MDDLLADFVAESREMLEALSGEMVAWEADPSDRARLDTIFRFFHTVKGNCGFFDFQQLEVLSHAAEDALAEVRAGRRVPDAGFVNAVLAVIDRIGEMVDAIDAGTEIVDTGDDLLIAALAGSGEPDALAMAQALPANGDEGAATVRSASSLRSIRLPVELLDRVMSGVSDMVLARNELARRIRDLGEDAELDGPFNRLSGILTDVRDAITRTRMQRIETLFNGFPRLVRDLSAELGKQVMVEIQGGDVELDREMIEMIRDPLVHIIRNAIDHGIETPAQRRAAGKREIGLLRISARQSGNQIRIGVSDDGRGIDTDRLVAKAVAGGVLSAETAATLTGDERNMLICEAGISTADTVTAVSGRGVGMDVVRANIEKIGGSLQVFSTRGSDTRIMLYLPLTLSIVPAITVSVSGQRFAIPRSYVDEIFHIGRSETELVRAGGQTMITLRDQRFACADLGAVLELPSAPISGGRSVVLIQLMAGEPFALVVDRVLDHQDLVIKPIAPIVMQTGIYVGTTQLDDGSPVLMLDAPKVGERAGLVKSGESGALRQIERQEAAATVHSVPVLLFVGLDGVRRAVNMNVVGRFEEVDAGAVRRDGGHAQIVIEDEILPLAGLAETAPPPGPLEVFRLSDGSCEVIYAIREMIDTAAIEGDLTPIEGSPLVAGIALIDGQPYEVLDSLALFARHARPATPARQPLCRMPADNRWLQDFLRPLVESAGYGVIDEAAEAEADVAIVLTGEEPDVTLEAANAILLRTTPEPDAGTAGTIYRYDREAVMAALQAAKQRKRA